MMKGDAMPIEIVFKEPMTDAEVYAVSDALHRIALAFEAQHYAQLQRHYANRESGSHDTDLQLCLPLFEAQ